MPAERILVVDDHEVNLALARTLLSLEGFAVETADGGASTLALLDGGYRPDLVLMDIQMPGMDGLELTRLLKARPELSGRPIVALTAYAMKGDEERIRAAGCDGYITKPIDVQTLGDQVRAHLALSAACRANPAQHAASPRRREPCPR